MLNLAPIKYANCFASSGGPLRSVEESKIEINGSEWSVANAYLNDDLRCPSVDKQVFGNIDGTGLDPNPLYARYKAISEAIERWAHFEVEPGKDRGKYGFDCDPTTNGMAAFPGVFAKQARKYALDEATERYAIIAWWQELLGIEELSTGDRGSPAVYRIKQPFREREVVVLSLKSKKGFQVFSFGSGSRLESAKEKAMLELERGRIVLEQFYRKNPGVEVGDLTTLEDVLEKRLVYFSMEEGVAAFERKVEATRLLTAPLIKPEVLFDGEIKGAWTQYAHVWRVALRMPTRDYLDKGNYFFFW